MSTLGYIAQTTQLDQKIHDYLTRKAVKIQTDDVFDKIRSSMGIVYDTTTIDTAFEKTIYKSGFFVSIYSKAYFVTTTPDLPDDVTKIAVEHFSGTYDLKYPDNLIQEKVKELKLTIFECYGRLSSEITFFDLVLPDKSVNPFKEGTKVYFGGCPLSSRRLAFHRGIISDYDYSQKMHTFMIDGTIVQGFSGGPVVMQHNGKIYLIGVIRSQIVISSKEDLSNHKEIAITQLYKSAIENRSTGIGNALDSNHCYELLDWEKIPSSVSETIENLSGLPFGEEFVSKKKKKEKQAIPIEAGGTVYYAHHDGHGFKHLYVNSKKLTKKQFINSTDNGGTSKFYPHFANRSNYENLVQSCVTEWAKEGADYKDRYIEYAEVVGADKGYETKTVKIYFSSDKLGAHIRPKYLG